MLGQSIKAQDQNGGSGTIQPVRQHPPADRSAGDANPIDTPEHQDRIRQMGEEVFDTFEASGATDLQFRRLSDFQSDERVVHLER